MNASLLGPHQEADQTQGRDPAHDERHEAEEPPHERRGNEVEIDRVEEGVVGGIVDVEPGIRDAVDDLAQIGIERGVESDEDGD